MKKIYNGLLLFIMLVANAIFGMEELLVIENPPFHNLNVKKSIENLKTECKWAIMNQINKNFVAPWYYENSPQDNPAHLSDARKEYQKLGQEAQDALGIPRKYQLPIKKAKFGGPDSNNQVTAAQTTPLAILINPDRFSQYTIGQKKFTLLHESAHFLHQDLMRGYVKEKSKQFTLSANQISLLITSGVLAGLCFSRKPEKIVSLLMNRLDPYAFFRFIFSINTGFYVGDKISKGTKNILADNDEKFAECERRADGAACEALNCYQCILEKSKTRYDSLDALKHASSILFSSQDNSYLVLQRFASEMRYIKYLSKEQLEEIAEKMKKEGKLCDEHAMVKVHNQQRDLEAKNKALEMLKLIDTTMNKKGFVQKDKNQKKPKQKTPQIFGPKNKK